MNRFAKAVAISTVTAGVLALSAGAALADNRHTSVAPQTATVSSAQSTDAGTVTTDNRHTS